jgi:serine O-acetyltransferase
VPPGSSITQANVQNDAQTDALQARGEVATR